MGLKKRSINAQGFQTDYKHLVGNYNISGINNPSNYVNLPTNFNLKSISLENIDQSVFREFDQRFLINNRPMPLILLDAEYSSVQQQNYVQFDQSQGFLNLPFFTFYRKDSKTQWRTNPGYKQVIYSIPKKKANGIVIEDYITEPPVHRILYYELSFISNYREHTNKIDEQMTDYFRNKRNIIIHDGERFVIGPTEQGTIGEVELINREDVEQRTLYLTTYNLRLWCYTRDLSKMQKIERPNQVSLNLVVSDSKCSFETKNVYNINQYEFQLTDYPTENTPEQQACFNAEINTTSQNSNSQPNTSPQQDHDFNNDFNNDFNI